MQNLEPRGRRRGAALETALLAAAWEHLTETGPAGFSLEAVAERAGTSKPVLYRRWANANEMLMAALAWRGKQDALEVPDLGTLHADLLGLLREANRQPERFLVFFKLIAGGWLQGTNLTPADLRDGYLSASPLGIDTVLDRAVCRGEIAESILTPRLRSLPFDLFRARLMMTLAPLEDAELAAIIDEVIMPLVTGPAPHGTKRQIDLV